MDGRTDWCLSDKICRTDWKNEAKHKVTICARSSLLPSILILGTSPLLQHSDNWNSQKWPWGSEKAKVLSEFSKEKYIQNNSMLRILGSTQNWTGNPSNSEVYNTDMILKIIEIRDEKVIWKLFSPPVLFNELSIFPVSTCSLIIHKKSLSRVQLFAMLWTVAYQAPLSIGFSRQEYWSGLPFLSCLFPLLSQIAFVMDINTLNSTKF